MSKRIRFLGLPVNVATTIDVTQGASSDTFSTLYWGSPEADTTAPVNTVAPTEIGTSNIGDSFGITSGTWENTVNSYEYRLLLDGVLEDSVVSFPTTVLPEWDGLIPTFGVRAIGPIYSSTWFDVVGDIIKFADAPVFTVDPSFGAASYTVGDTVLLDLGVAGPSAALAVNTFTSGGVSKTGELTGTGSGREWDTTGETPATMSFRVSATNSGGTRLSNIVTASLVSAGVGGDFYPTSISTTAKGGRINVLDLMGFGTADSITVSAPDKGHLVKRVDGKFTLDCTTVKSDTGDTVTFGYTAAKSGESPVVGTATVTVSRPTARIGWGIGKHYYLPVDGNDKFIPLPGLNHRKVYCSNAGLTKAAIEAGVPTGNANAQYLEENIVPVGLGGNGTWKYGEAPEVALAPTEARGLWDRICAFATYGAVSHWLLWKAGETISFSGTSDGRRGESPVHPIVFTRYGTGENPIVNFAILPRPGGSRNILVQDVDTVDATPAASGLSWTAVDGYSPGAGNELLSAPSNYISEGVTFRRVKSLNSSREVPSGGVQWNSSSDRKSSVFALGNDGLLIEKYFNDISGWAEGHLKPGKGVVHPAATPQPPSALSHCFYLDGQEGLPGGIKGPLTNWDTTVRQCGLSRGALTGIQFRPGGISKGNFFFRNNLGVFFGGGELIVEGVDEGCWSLSQGDVFSHAGQKILQGGGVTARAFNIGVPDTVLDNVIVAHKGPANDGSSAWGEANPNDRAINVDYSPNALDNPQNGSILLRDVTVDDWVNVVEQEGMAGVNPTTAANTTVEKWLDQKLATTGSTYTDFINYMRAQDEPWLLVPEIREFFQQGYNRYTAPRSTAATAIFAPSGTYEGHRWDQPRDWTTGDIPGSVAGDSADLDGHIINTFLNTTLVNLDLGGGELRQWGGRTTASTLPSGGTISLDKAGAFFFDGYSAGETLTIKTNNGMLRNTGTVSNVDGRFGGFSRNLIGYDGSSWTVGAGRSLEIHGGRCRVGFDGSTGGAASLTVAGALTFKTTYRVPFRDRIMPKTFVIGAVIRGATSGFVGTIVDLEDVPTSIVAAAAAQQGGYIYLENVSGTPLPGEALIGEAREGYFSIGEQTIANVGVEWNPATDVTIGRIGKFRSGLNGTTAPNVAATVTLQAGSILNVDVRGLPNGAYDLIGPGADAVVEPGINTLTGTFTTVDVQGGTGTVSYTGTKVIFTKTA